MIEHVMTGSALFGLNGVLATFQRLMDHVIHGLDFAATYLDDLIILVSCEEHLTHIRMVLERLPGRIDCEGQEV